MLPLHKKIAQVALKEIGRHGFVLAGGYALAAQLNYNRISEDVDLFTPEEVDDRQFKAAVMLGVTTLRDAGFVVEHGPLKRDDLYPARIFVSDGSSREKVEFSRMDRFHAPVVMDVGPVQNIKDCAASKMQAMWNRRLPRDFIDVYALREFGGYRRSELYDLAKENAQKTGRKFDEPGNPLESALREGLHINRFKEFQVYGIDEQFYRGMRRELRGWIAELSGEDEEVFL